MSGKASKAKKKEHQEEIDDSVITLVAEVLGCEPPVWENIRVPLLWLRHLPQVRKSMTKIANLAETFITAGAINPMTVFLTNRKGALGYIEQNNGLHRGNLSLRDLRCAPDLQYYITIAGHRRLLGNRYIWDHGCKKCRRKYGREPAGTCYKRHFPDGMVEIRVCRNLTPLLATCIQHIENIHVPVPPTEDAPATAALFDLLRGIRPGIPISKVAALLGKSDDQVSDALHFRDLPEAFRNAANNKDISYGVALAFESIIREARTNEKIKQCFPEGYENWLEERWLTKVALGETDPNKLDSKGKPRVIKYTPEKVKRDVRGATLEVVYAQLGLELGGGPIKRNMRPIILNSSRGLFLGGADYLLKAIHYLESGQLEEYESPARDRQFRQDFTKLTDLYRKFAQHLKGLTAHDRKRALELAHETIKSLEELEALEAIIAQLGG